MTVGVAYAGISRCLKEVLTWTVNKYLVILQYSSKVPKNKAELKNNIVAIISFAIL